MLLSGLFIEHQLNFYFYHKFQVIWVCILCRKKQELLSKTGQWINKSTSPDGVIRRIDSDTRVIAILCCFQSDIEHIKLIIFPLSL